ncbi:predicted GPI-anchored protein 58 [Drosophila subobscura]|uniref:predicted GPI-anchored protein 58 n=1 Tax=Drosophila subobscura TaxID=7241 RepID=UPI00155B3E31|nr:predicted GPI-anchored protein 58 [Drosophila subobscura]
MPKLALSQRRCMIADQFWSERRFSQIYLTSLVLIPPPTMSGRRCVQVFFLVALLGLTLVPFSQARPGRGRKRAFGVGMLGGVLAGGLIGHAVAKHQSPAAAAAPAPVAQVHHYYPAGAPAAPVQIVVQTTPDPRKLTVIETGQPDASGCYKQTVREPNPANPKTYTETQHLICPTLTQAQQPAPAIAMPPSAAFVPVMPQPSAVLPAPAAAPAPAAPHPVGWVAPVATNSSSVAHHPVIPAYPVIPALPAHPSPNAAAAVPAPAAAIVHPPTYQVAQPNAPVAAAAPAPAPGQTPHVIVLSKKTVYYPKKKSSAPSLMIPQGILAILAIFYSSKVFWH